MQLKKKEDQIIDASILHRTGNKIITGSTGTWEEERRGRVKVGKNSYWKGQERSEGQKIE